MSTTTLPAEYTIIFSPPPSEAYLQLRLSTGLTPKSAAQASGAETGSWYAVHLLHMPYSQVVRMGRVIGDGGWHFHIADMAVHPDYQRKGLSDAILQNLLDTIEREAPEFLFVTLLADPLGKKLHSRHEFVEMSLVGRRGVGMQRYQGVFAVCEGFCFRSFILSR